MNSQAISDAVSGLGWRYILGTLRTSVSVRSLAEAADVAVRVAAAARDRAGQLALDLRPDRLVLTVHPAAGASMTADDVGLARRLSDVVITGGLRADPGGGDDRSRSVQLLEIAIDAINIPSRQVACCSLTTAHPRSGSWPTPKVTKPA